MKTVMLKACFIALITFSCFSFASARQVVITNMKIRDVNHQPPCDYVVNGTVDITVKWGWPPIQIDHYDITISGPCGTFHLVGKIAETPDPNAPNHCDDGSHYFSYDITDTNGDPAPNALSCDDFLSMMYQIDEQIPEE